MRNLLTIATLTVVLALGFTQAASAGTTVTHAVTVTVSAVNEVAISGGAITMTINAAVAGSEPTTVTDATKSLSWTTNEATARKITVVTDVITQKFTLKLTATGISGGTAASQLTITTTAQSLVTAINKTTGTCTLSYAASATAAQGTGSDVHTLTYTILAA